MDKVLFVPMFIPTQRVRFIVDVAGALVSRSRVGYFEWIEMLFRVAFIQCSKAKSVSKRLEMLLTERVLPKGE